MENKAFQELCKGFEGLTDGEKVCRMCGELEKAGIQRIRSEKRSGAVIEYYTGAEAVFAVRNLPNGGEKSFIILDRGFYDEELADGRGCLYYKDKGGKYRVVFQRGEVKHRDLHRYVMTKAGVELGGSYCVDHKFHSVFINTREALRVATYQQNRGNSKFLKHRPKEDDNLSKEDYKAFTDQEKDKYEEFAYDPLTDFTDTWYAYAAYKMLGIGSWKELEDYNRDFILRTDEDAAKYYWEVLGYSWEEA